MSRFNKLYLEKVLENPNLSKKLLKENKFPVLKVDVDFELMTREDYGKYLEMFGEKKFVEVYTRVNGFSNNWIELSSGDFYSIGQLKGDKTYFGRNLVSFSNKERDFILDFRKHLETSKVNINISEFYESLKSFADEDSTQTLEDYFLVLPLKEKGSEAGIVKKKLKNKEISFNFYRDYLEYSGVIEVNND